MFECGGRMSEGEAAEKLLMQARNWGTYGLFRGISPFYFMKRLGLFQPEFTCLRIFAYWGNAVDEIGYYVTADAKIMVGRDEKVMSARKLLSLKNAVSGWEIHHLIPEYGDIVEQWIKEHPELSDS